jgi:hypothetical protein
MCGPILVVIATSDDVSRQPPNQTLQKALLYTAEANYQYTTAAATSAPECPSSLK